MKYPNSGLRLDSPSWPLLQAHVSYWDVATADGSALGTTVVCSRLANEPDYVGLSVKVLDGPAAGQVRPISVHGGGNTLTVPSAWTDTTGAVVQVTAGTRFVILSTGGGGAAPAPVPAPSIGLWMFGECDPGMAASTDTLVLTNLAGFPDNIFTNEFWVQVIHNADNPGGAPEREIRRVTNYVGATGAFTTDAFTANVDANDLVCVFHESIMSVEVLGFGTLTTDSATVPADNTRTEQQDAFNGCLLMPTEEVCAFQPRRIVQWTLAGGVFTLDPNNPLAAAPGLVDYVIIGGQTPFVPAVDGTNNYTPSDVIGSKDDTAIAVADNVSSVIRYLKGIIAAVAGVAEIPVWNTPNTGTHTTTGVTEETILTTAYTVPGLFYFNLTLRNMIAGDDFTIRVYKRVDGTNYDLKSVQNFVDAPAVKVYEIEGLYTDDTEFIRVTIQRNSGTNRAFPYSYNCIKQP